VNIYEQLADKFPFITYLKYGDSEYVGIVQNKDYNVTTIYDYESIPSDELKILFLELGDAWWWESNRLIPINIFLKGEFEPFKPYARTFNNKDINLVHGPCISLTDISTKRVKRRSIQLVRRLPKSNS